MPTISILCLGISNTNSVKVAFESIGADIKLVNQAVELGACDGIVMPGVGSFRHAMEALAAGGYPERLQKAVVEDRTPFLGICLGMQMLAEEGDEGGRTEGLGWIGGNVRRLQPPSALRVPHIGWDDIRIRTRAPLFEGLPQNPSFYFVHSYYLDAEPAHVSATCDYGAPFPVSVQKDNIFGVQFHPEKSQKNGTMVLKNFLEHIKR
jgi:glutamine amidotransferase